ncbi:hypothetical protein [Parabacteroides sp. PF5-9]|uniref:hypothetical protein n=1 Tax=Parabacteroides sp. PF5-9 TaxID=1742404 RepID=UPI0024748329|nr:hypothetical protein [Parabacteroides sp. PF5-9]MDH6358135.1 hypothetical protein [Parabacteroides sp. PF5-9]
MDKLQYKAIADKIVSQIPVHLNPIDFLADVLDLSKESVYRRVKGKVPFTVNDFVKLSSTLSVSMDEVLFSNRADYLNSKSTVFAFHGNRAFDTEETFYDLLLTCANGVKKMNEVQHTELIATFDRVMISTAASYDYLFKYHYYKWMCQMRQMPLDFRLSDVELPERIIALQKKVSDYKAVGKQTYILHPYFIKNSLMEVHYYYKRKLISEEEIVLIQNDFFSLIDSLENKLKQPDASANNETHIYLSTFSIESTGLSMQYDHKVNALFSVYPGAYIVSRDPEICKAYTYWLHSLKKYASLISGCNEALQTKFIDTQREFVVNLVNKTYTYD